MDDKCTSDLIQILVIFASPCLPDSSDVCSWYFDRADE